MSITNQRISLCKFLANIAGERRVSIDTLSTKTGIDANTIRLILQGEGSPCVDQLIAIANELDMQLTFQQNICFAHKKAAGSLRL